MYSDCYMLKIEGKKIYGEKGLLLFNYNFSLLLTHQQNEIPTTFKAAPGHGCWLKMTINKQKRREG